MVRRWGRRGGAKEGEGGKRGSMWDDAERTSWPCRSREGVRLGIYDEEEGLDIAARNTLRHRPRDKDLLQCPLKRSA